jgi:hypothetical protein
VQVWPVVTSCVCLRRSPQRSEDTRRLAGRSPALDDLEPLSTVDVQILRHSKIAVTMEVYAQVVSASTKDALRRLASSSTRAMRHDRCCTLLLYGPVAAGPRLR